MKAVYELALKPLSLNEMIAARYIKDKFKRQCFALLSEYLEHDERTVLHVHITKKGKKKFVYRKYPKPIFDIVNMKWQIHFEKSNRRDLGNFVGGLKWATDCLVEMNILTDDSIEHILKESYRIVCPSKFTGLRVVING